ncbi:hypothetical protein ACFO8O_13050 [Hephaestia sp. GCM10023244]|uniref:hypothetical protein n=1 Tax=unclassified Hephaestia TaxID=2631281 RepID=UPI0020773E35|nr:hypothetical protein [Hephaestia sp. MAHUQ-44]MCM8731888.1 hypothetical protein [Hephaestia sp. MAHUQ-44]
MSKLSVPARLIVLAGAATLLGTGLLPATAMAKDRIIEVSAKYFTPEITKVCLPRSTAPKDKRADLPKDPCLTQAEWAEHGVKIVARK